MTIAKRVWREGHVTPNLESTNLYKWLKRKDDALANRVKMIRGEVSKWLPQIIQVFPHYPSHGVDHSDRIVAQLAKMLWKRKPVVEFSPAEIYCLLCAAYLHDMGMVVPPSQVESILGSAAWRAFVALEGRGAQTYAKYIALRAQTTNSTDDVHAFLCDRALRLLVAEFVRQDHHERGKTVLELHPFLKALVDHGDPVTFTTISDIGVGHGFDAAQLSDEHRFPDRRTVLGDEVNVRLLARLLRIGDLLDMDTSRADPTTAAALDPLPADAVPHWRQYSAKTHELVAPDKIEFRFECQDQETHRILRDWFGWLESEVRETALEQLHAERHQGWRAPRCVVASGSESNRSGAQMKPTIVITPAKSAKYTFHDWKLELDHEQVFHRLIYDVYDSPEVFIRELIQNALDATRCQMYSDFSARHAGTNPPTRPTQFAEDFRNLYPVKLCLTQEEVQSSPDGKPEKRLVFTIEDFGTGMTEPIIRRYFLQIGRSYYQSSEFRERYTFAPTSRFGVGFLSVFAVSENVVVETACQQANGEVSGLRLRLRGPRSYLLTEHWIPFPERASDTRHGTRIRVVLKEWPAKSRLVDFVRKWCVSVEVPIMVTHGDEQTIVHPERLCDGTEVASSNVDPAARFILRCFDVNSHGVEGQIGLLAYQDDQGDGWCDCWSDDTGLDGRRADRLPECPRSFAAVHGILIHSDYDFDTPWDVTAQWFARTDLRAGVGTLPLQRVTETATRMQRRMRTARSGANESASSVIDEAVQASAQAAVTDHLRQSIRARGHKGIYYVGKVLSVAPVPENWRTAFPRTVVTWQRGKRVDRSAAELLALEQLALAFHDNAHTRGRDATPRHASTVNSEVPIVSIADTPRFVDDRLEERILTMMLCGLERHDDLWLWKFSTNKAVEGLERVADTGRAWVADFDGFENLGVRVGHYGGTGQGFVVFSRGNPFVQWLTSLQPEMERLSIDRKLVKGCWGTVARYPYDIRKLVTKWSADPNVPPDLRPPQQRGAGQLHTLDVYARPTVVES